jgi:hypothetical protein
MRLNLLHSLVFIYKHLNLFFFPYYIAYPTNELKFFVLIFHAHLPRNYSSHYLHIFSSTDVTAEAIMDHPSYITWLATTAYIAVRRRHIERYSLHKNIGAFHVYRCAEVVILSILMGSGTKDVDVSSSHQSIELSLHLIRCYNYYIHVITIVLQNCLIPLPVI